MANKDQKRGNRETRKPKQNKPKPAAQATGWLHLNGLLAAIPPGLVLLAVLGQLVGVTRAVLVWLAG